MTFPGGRRSGWALTAVLAVLVIAAGLRYSVGLRGSSTFQDFRVYLDGAQAVAQGISPYAARAGGHGQLVFTYPPFAALTFRPWLVLPAQVAPWLFTATSVVALVGVVALFGRKMGTPPERLWWRLRRAC